MEPDEAAVSEKQEVLVRFNEGVSTREAENLAENLGLMVVKSTSPTAVTGGRVLLVVQSMEMTGDEIINLLQKHPEVDRAEIHVVRKIQNQ